MSSLELEQGKSTIKQAMLGVANRLAQMLPFLRRKLDASAKNYGRIARTYYEDKDYESAIANYKTALIWSPRDTELLNELAQVYYETDSFKQAEFYFRKVLDYDYYNPRALKGLGFTLHWSGNPDEAMYAYLRYLNVKKDDADVLLNLGALVYDSGQYEQALGYFQQAVSINHSEPLGFLNLAGALYNLGRIAEAEVAVQQSLALEKNADAYQLLGSILEAQQKHQEALESYSAAANVDPENGYAHRHLARLYNRIGSQMQYFQHAQEAVRLLSNQEDPESLASAYWDLGWAYYLQGDWQKSVEASAKALEFSPDLAPPRFNVGLALLRQHKSEEARHEYLIGLEKSKPSDLRSDAIDDLEHALEVDPDMPGARDILKILNAEYEKLEQRTSASSDAGSNNANL